MVVPKIKMEKKVQPILMPKLVQKNSKSNKSYRVTYYKNKSRLLGLTMAVEVL